MSSNSPHDPILVRRPRLLCLLAPAAVLLALSSGAAAPAAAQEAPPDTAAPLPVAPLTVTILREPAPGSLVPYAISAVDAGSLRLGRSGAFLDEALSMLPGVQVQNRFNYAVGERLAVRGFGPRAQFGVRGVKVLVDGIPATMADGQSTLDHLDLASLGRAEVLRGPGSALYGNAAGGVLVFRTAIPAPGPLRPEARVVTGSDGLLNVTAGTGGWVGGTALNLTASRLSYGGFRDDPTEPGGTYGEADRWLVNGQATTAVAGGSLRVTLNAVTLEAENPGSLPRDALSDDGRPAWRGNVAQGTRKDVDQAQLGAVWDGPVAGGRGEVALWGLGRDLVNPIPPAIVDLSRRAGGARLLWGAEAGDSSADPDPAADGPAFTWGAGVELEHQRDDRRNFDNDGGTAGALTLDQLERVTALGGFVRAGVRPADRLRLTGALRWDRFRFEADDRFVVSGDPDDSGSRTMDAWSPTLGAVFEPDPRVEIWANVSTAVETPTTTELVNRPGGGGGFNPELEAQRSTGLEAGARGRLGRSLTWELVAFHTELEDELVPFESQGGRTFFRNAGSSEHDGLEATLDLRLGAGVDVTAVYSRTDARFETYEVEGADFSGNRVPGLAPNRFRGRVGQERPRLFWAVETEWNDEVPVDDSNEEAADAYWLVGARAGLRDLSAAGLVFSPFAGVANLLDERYTTSVTVNAFGGRYYEPGPGRTGYVGLSLRWDRR